MNDILFEYLEKESFSENAPHLFSILHANMTLIAPTGNSYEEDYECWRDAFGSAFVQQEERKIILILSRHRVVGFFCYSVNGDIFRMEEIQIIPDYQGKDGVFRNLYSFVVKNLPENLQYVEAFANKKNSRSLAILDRLGLKIIGTNRNHTSYHLRGTFDDLLLWLNRSSS